MLCHPLASRTPSGPGSPGPSLPQRRKTGSTTCVLTGGAEAGGGTTYRILVQPDRDANYVTVPISAGGRSERRSGPGIPAWGRERGQQIADLAGDALEGRLVVLGGGDDGLVHPGRERLHVLLAQAAGGDR